MFWKKATTLYGNLIQPLRVGDCALIRTNGKTMRTSKVVSITALSPDQISFETMNTSYTLLNPVVAQVNVIPSLMGAAA